MTVQRQATIWLIVVLAVALTLYVLSSVLLPFVAGITLAYLLDPAADKLQSLGLRRLAATIVILTLFLLAFVLALFLLAPLVANQISTFIAKFPENVALVQSIVAEHGGPLLARFGGPGTMAEIQKSLGNMAGQGAGLVSKFVESLWSGGQAIVSIVALLVVTPVVAFYLLVDWDRMIARIDSWLPIDHRETVRMIVLDIDKAIAGFLRGQALVCVVLGTFYAIALSIMGLSFGALIGFVSGLLSFIPYVGSLIGLLLSVGVAIIQFWPDWTMPLIALAIFSIGQFVEGNILSPKLVGASVGLHPVWLMFALLAFGTMFGFVGLLMAVPLAAVIGVLTRFMLVRYLESHLYAGRSHPEAVILEPEPVVVEQVSASVTRTDITMTKTSAPRAPRRPRDA